MIAYSYLVVCEKATHDLFAGNPGILGAERLRQRIFVYGIEHRRDPRGYGLLVMVPQRLSREVLAQQFPGVTAQWQERSHERLWNPTSMLTAYWEDRLSDLLNVPRVKEGGSKKA